MPMFSPFSSFGAGTWIESAELIMYNKATLVVILWDCKEGPNDPSF